LGENRAFGITVDTPHYGVVYRKNDVHGFFRRILSHPADLSPNAFNGFEILFEIEFSVFDFGQIAVYVGWGPGFFIAFLAAFFATFSMWATLGNAVCRKLIKTTLRCTG
jgi:hypothetical protein